MGTTYSTASIETCGGGSSVSGETTTSFNSCTDAWGNTYEHGAQWNDGACTDCSCNNGVVECISIDCEIPECEEPNYLQDVEG